MSHKYKIAYQIEQGEFTKEELAKKPGDWGGCDSIIVHSIIGDVGSQAVMSMDGETGKQLTDEQMFKAWALMAHGLSEKLPEGKRKDLTRAVHEMVRSAIMKQRDLDGDLPDTITRHKCDGCGYVFYIPYHYCPAEAQC